MKLGCCLVASDLNPDYLDFFPLVQRAWREVVGIEVRLVLIANGPAPEPAAIRARDSRLSSGAGPAHGIPGPVRQASLPRAVAKRMKRRSRDNKLFRRQRP